MAEVNTLFFDIGGVLLTNGWDRPTRRKAAAQFGLDDDDFEARHESLVSALETGKISLDEYLDQTVFCRPCSFSREQFKSFIYAQSQPNSDSLAFVRELAGRFLLAAINNESHDLNLYRIEKFRLREIFTVFFSSCFVRLRKPDPAIYRLALDMTQKAPDECCFIDDRSLNIEGARQVGMRAIQFQDVNQLRRELAEMGVAVAPIMPAA